MGINVGDVKHYFRSQREKQGVDIEEDESTFCDQNLKNIPKTITTPDGTNVSIEFGVSSDGVSSDQKVAPGIISALERALHQATTGIQIRLQKYSYPQRVMEIIVQKVIITRIRLLIYLELMGRILLT